MKRTAAVCAVLALCTAIVVPCVRPDVHAAQGAEPASAVYDYTRDGVVNHTERTAADVLTALGYAPNGAELAYLAAHEPFRLRYSETIGGSNIDATFTDGVVRIAARPYTYMSKGEEIAWLPAAADGVPLAEAQGYAAELPAPQEDYVTVDYVAELPVGGADLDRILNGAYRAAVSAKDKLAEEAERYARETAVYEQQRIDYDAYLAELARYETAQEEYLAAQKAHALWQERSDAYSAYLREYDVYRREREAYDSYEERSRAYQAALQEYKDYCAAQENYERLYAQYLEGLTSEAAKKVLRQTAILDFIFTPMPLPDGTTRTFYHFITGDTVTQVLAQRDLLIEYAGADKDAVLLAERTTRALRDDLLPKLAACDTLEKKYVYYLGCYEELKNEITELFRALDYLFRNNIVKKEVERRGRVPQFRLLLAQFYYLCNALNEGDVKNYELEKNKSGKRGYFDILYRIDGMSPASLIGGVTPPDIDQDPLPLAEGYPELPPEPVAPKPVKDPGAPPAAPSRVPVAPTPVAPPGEEPAVPAAPSAPAHMDEPQAPVPYAPSEEETALTQALEGGELAPRELPARCVYAAKVSVRKYFRNAREMTVRFYNGDTLLFSVDGYVGAYLEYPGELPEKERTGYTCTFAGWVDRTGALVNFSEIDPGTERFFDVFASFTETPKLYPVVWIVEGERYERMCAFDAIPQFDGTPEKAPEGERCFRFTGWDRPLEPMTEAGATYTAQFERNLFVTWLLYGGESRRDVAWRGEIPKFGEAPVRAADNRYTYAFSGWDRTVGPMTEDTSYTAQFKATPYVGFGNGDCATVERTAEGFEANCLRSEGSAVDPSELFRCAIAENAGAVLRFSACTLSLTAGEVRLAEDATTIVVDVMQTGEGRYSYCVRVFGAEGAIEGTGKLRTEGVFDPEHDCLVRFDGETETDVRYESDGAEITFVVVFGDRYETSAQYAIEAVGSELVKIAVPRRARAGVRVVPELEFAEGTHLDTFSVRCADGAEIAVQDGGFLMPAQAVTLVVIARYNEYKVTFVADGRTIATRTVQYGETVVPPADPIKPADGAYSYYFDGWDKAFGPITKDTKFIAIFRGVPLEVPKMSPSREYVIYKTLLIGGSVLLALTAAGLTTFFVLRWRKKKETMRKSDENS